MRDCLPTTQRLAFILGFITIWPTLAFGGFVVRLNNEGSTTLHEIVVGPGDVFSLDVNASLPGDGIAVGLDLVASESDRFSLLQVSYHAPWSSPLSKPPVLGGLDPSRRLDALLPEPVVAADVTATVATIQVGVDAATPLGTYGLDALNAQGVQGWFSGDIVILSPGPTFSIQVVPEPCAASLVAIGFLVISRRRVG